MNTSDLLGYASSLDKCPLWSRKFRTRKHTWNRVYLFSFCIAGYQTKPLARIINIQSMKTVNAQHNISHINAMPDKFGANIRPDTSERKRRVIPDLKKVRIHVRIWVVRVCLEQLNWSYGVLNLKATHSGKREPMDHRVVSSSGPFSPFLPTQIVVSCFAHSGQVFLPWNSTCGRG